MMFYTLTQTTTIMKVVKTKTEDINGIYAVEVERYAELYKEFPDKKAKFTRTLGKRIDIASKWMWVLKDKDKVLGSISAQPTDKTMDDFVSWEESTNNGTLEGTYVENGKNLYVVNLDVLREATKKGGQYMLMSYMAAQFLENNMQYVFFESRIPGFRQWTLDNNISAEEWSNLSDNRKTEIAKEYAYATTYKNNKKIYLDRLINFYIKSGFNMYKLVENAFEDPESHNFGVIFYKKNPLPSVLRVKPLRHLVAILVRLTSKNSKILELIV